jgi:hypothetical protein
MERALQPSLLPPAISLACEPCPRAAEPVISRPARPWISGAAGMLLAAATAGAYSHPAQAQVADCLTEPNVPAPEGTHWSSHDEINNYRRCWVLRDAAGHQVAAPAPAQPAGTSTWAWRSFLGNFRWAGTPQAAPASPSARKPQTSQPDGPPRVVTASKPAGSEPPKSEVRPVKRETGQPNQDALFEEFLRWRESDRITGTK